MPLGYPLRGALQDCHKALRRLRPGQKVNCVPGMAALSSKGLLAASLTAAYGEGAFDIIPRSYRLPDQYWRWRAWLKLQVSANTTCWHWPS